MTAFHHLEFYHIHRALRYGLPSSIIPVKNIFRQNKLIYYLVFNKGTIWLVDKQWIKVLNTELHAFIQNCLSKNVYYLVMWPLARLNFQNRTNRTKVMAKKLKLVSPWKGCFQNVYPWIGYFKIMCPWKGCYSDNSNLLCIFYFLVTISFICLLKHVNITVMHTFGKM